MLDINVIREQTDFVKDGMAKVGEDPALIDRAVDLDVRWRAVVTEVDELKADRNRESKLIGKMEAGDERDALVVRMREVGDRIKELDAESTSLREDLDDLMLRIPNVPHEDAPVGAGEEENVVVRTEGELPELDFEPKAHWDMGPELGIIDFERGTRMSGSRFYVLMGDGARLQRALISFMLDLHTGEHGYREVYAQFLVNGKCLVGTGNLPKFDENLYRDHEDDLWLIPTAEVPLTNLHREEILDEADLPTRYVGYTACFRREKMSAGRDTRGIKRGHQFDIRAGQARPPGHLGRRAGSADRRRRTRLPPAGAAVSTGGDVHGRPEFRGVPQVRPGGLGGGMRRVAGGEFVQQLPRLPGAPRQHTVPSGRRRQPAVRSHDERLGPGAAAHHDRCAGEQPAGGRVGPRAGSAQTLHGRAPEN